MRKSQSGYGGGARCGRTGRTESVRTFFQFVALLDQPVIQQLAGVRGHGGKAKARTARLIDPCDLHFGSREVAIPGKFEHHCGGTVPGQLTVEPPSRMLVTSRLQFVSSAEQASPRDGRNSAGAHESMMASTFLESPSGADPAGGLRRQWTAFPGSIGEHE